MDVGQEWQEGPATDARVMIDLGKPLRAQISIVPEAWHASRSCGYLVLIVTLLATWRTE